MHVADEIGAYSFDTSSRVAYIRIGNALYLDRHI